jgi:Zn-dependent M28 family amino/carboxypeptidase
MRRGVLAAAIVALTTLLIAPAASAIDKVDTKQLRKAVTVDGILDHERALQTIANANDGNRAATKPGYDASVDYVAERLRRAGYKVSFDEFDFPIWTLDGPSTLAEISPTARTFVEDTDYIVSQFSGAGDLTANLVPTSDIEVPPSGGAGTGTSGCEATDFPAATAGNIALMQRGTCPFVDKFDNAKAAGAAGALIFNDGGEGREEPLFITATAGIGIPTAMISNDIGESLFAEASAGTVSVRIDVDATTTPNQEINVIADSRKGKKGRTIVSGAHLDSVPEGPGINDNGSGTAGTLEVAEQIARLKGEPRNRVRFAFWGAEEAGLVGSTAYVAEQAESGGIDQIEANLNFDMIGSPNFVRFVYDGDLSDSEPPPSGAPDGSAQIEDMFLRYFRSRALATAPTAFDGRSDYGPFIENGVAAGGLFTGAEEIKTAQEEAIFGGAAGLAYDPCYHQACDTFANLSTRALNQMSDAVAHSMWTLAESKSPVTTPQSGNAAKAAKAGRAAARADGSAFRYQGPIPTR